MRRAAKRDANEREIIALWESLGCYVEPVSSPGAADTLVHFDGHLWRAEVKGAKRGLTDLQVEHFTAVYNAGVATYVVRTPQDAAMLLEDTLDPWTPSMGALAGAERKEREHRPGHSRARTVMDMCRVDHCIVSRLDGQAVCAKHRLCSIGHVGCSMQHPGVNP